MDKLSKGERMVFWSSVALLVCSFVPLWSKYEVSVFGSGFSEKGTLWNSYGFFPGKLAGLLVLATVILLLVRMFASNVSLPNTLWAGLGGGTAILVLLALVMGPEGQGLGVAGAGLEISRGFMTFVGLVLAAAMAWGGYQHMNEGAVSTPTPPPAPQAP